MTTLDQIAPSPVMMGGKSGPPPARILVVDDEARNLRYLEALLETDGYTVKTAASGEAALRLVPVFRPDLILLDIMMPGIDGFQVAGRLKLDPETKTIPIIMVTALDDRDSKIHALEMGAEEFLTKPIERAELWVRIRNLLRLREFSKFLEDHNHILEQQVKERSAQLTASYRETIHTMNRAASYRDEKTGAHVERISWYCIELAAALGLDEEYRDCIFYASPMHDIGKIGIPDAVLQNPAPLTAAEWALMKTHTVLGAKMLEGGDSPYLTMGREIALSHHERWDGSGYPQELAGEAIPLAARIMQIADVYDALRSRRPYKPPFAHQKALDIILNGNERVMPGHFDPQVLAVFRATASKLRKIYDSRAG
ncbi:MAG: response regulator [Nitrosomonadaceae bacterium]|nr:response regulator [Nitrosomonadaceae bacterium]